MESRDDKGHDEQHESKSPREGGGEAGQAGPSAGPQVIRTDDPAITADPVQHSDRGGLPDRTEVIETSRIRGPNEAFTPNFVVVPVETGRPPRERSGDGGGGEKANGKENEKEKGQGSKDENAGKDQSDSSKEHKGDRDKSGGRDEDHRGWMAKARSSGRGLLIPALVALVCGVAGAWGYEYFFGSDKGSDSSKSSDSNKKSDSSEGSDSGSSKGSKAGRSSEPGKGSNTEKSSDADQTSNSDEGSDSSKKGEDTGKLLQAEEAWLTAVKQLKQAQDAEKAARNSEGDKKAVLDFLKNTLLSAGRREDASLTEAFWSGGRGKDMSLHKALDVAESQVSRAFEERPLAEATVREILGLGYLNLGDGTQAVKEYEKALALREAMQGLNHPETAACRNQLATAYRLAGRKEDADRLFDQNPYTSSHASALAVRGSLLLLQKKPAEAELKLRESLSIRQKIQPDDWATFDTMSMLGEALLDQQKFAEAEPMLLGGHEGLKQREAKIPPEDKPRLTRALERLVRLYEVWDRPDKAMRWRKELEKAGSRAGGQY